MEGPRRWSIIGLGFFDECESRLIELCNCVEKLVIRGCKLRYYELFIDTTPWEASARCAAIEE
jgi:hypothetical protein